MRDLRVPRSGLIESGLGWRYIAEGVVPAGVTKDQAEAAIRTSVSWMDHSLGVFRRSRVEVYPLGGSPKLEA